VEGVFLLCERVSDEAVFIARRVSACLLVCVDCPEVFAAFDALFPRKALFLNISTSYSEPLLDNIIKYIGWRVFE